MANYKCAPCADSGIINAELIKMKNEQGRIINTGVNVMICGGHFDTSLSEQTIDALTKTTGLSVNIAGVVKPEELTEDNNGN